MLRHRKQGSAPPSLRAHGDPAGPPRGQTQCQESVFTSSSGPGQAVGMATWSQDGVSAVITISITLRQYSGQVFIL